MNQQYLIMLSNNTYGFSFTKFSNIDVVIDENLLIKTCVGLLLKCLNKCF